VKLRWFPSTRLQTTCSTWKIGSPSSIRAPPVSPTANCSRSLCANAAASWRGSAGTPGAVPVRCANSGGRVARHRGLGTKLFRAAEQEARFNRALSRTARRGRGIDDRSGHPGHSAGTRNVAFLSRHRARQTQLARASERIDDTRQVSQEVSRLGVAGCQACDGRSPLSSRASHALANLQSRITVCAET
jgi:hypothetical protein